MDLVYLLGTGSTWDNNELRYSLRSACEHFQHGKVFVVGYCPPWLQDVIHLPVPDLSPNKVVNQLTKLTNAVRDARLSQHFLLMNDDFLFTKRVEKPEAYVHCTLQQSVSQPRGTRLYDDMDRAALSLLKRNGIADPLSFETHTPLPMDRTTVSSMLSLPGASSSDGYHFRSVYGNLAGLPATICEDPKVRIWSGRVPSLPVMSLGDDIAHDLLFHSWLSKRWPSPCKYER